MKLPAASSLNRRISATITLLITSFMFGSFSARAETAPALLDDFSNAPLTHTGAARLLIDDKAMGSQSHATQQCEKGVLVVQGELVPGRGVPAFISVPLLLSPDAKPMDLGTYQGVRLRVKITKGTLIVQVASSEVENFDYHASGQIAGKYDEFLEVRLPFKDMKRGWSEQTVLNLKSITSVNLVVFGLAKSDFAYQVKEIGFY